MSKYSQHLEPNSSRIQSSYAEIEGFKPRSPLTADLLNGFPLPPNLSLKSRRLAPPIPISRTSYSDDSEDGRRPLAQLPRDLLLSPEPLIDTRLPLLNSRRSSITDEELPYHFNFSPSVYSDTTRSNSYFPLLPILSPPVFPSGARMNRKPSLPTSPAPQTSLPLMPSFVSVFIDPASEPSSPYIVDSPLRSDTSTIDIRSPTETEREGKNRRRKNASLQSKWSNGAGLSKALPLNGKELWSPLASEFQEEGLSRREEKARRRDDKLEKRLQSQERKNRLLTGESTTNFQDQWTSKKKSSGFLLNIRSRFTKSSFALLLAIVILSISVIILTVHFIRPSSSTTLKCSVNCDFINANCVTLPGSSYPIAQGLLDVAAASTASFSPSINSSRLALIVNKYLNLTTAATDCREQLSIISVPSLPPPQFPRRSSWATAAILWSIATTETPSTPLLSFVSSLNFTQLGDFPSTSPDVNFQIQYFGYIFDFGMLQLSTPAVSWINQSSPSTSQSSIMTPTSIPSETLDLMYSHSLAASMSRTLSLEHYWNELGLASSDLRVFVDAVLAAPVVIPFDATSPINGVGIMNLAMKSTTFPPAIGCLGGINSLQTVGMINSVEVTAFGLKKAGISDPVDLTCLDRPLYGMINLLSLRLPFLDSDRRSIPLQGLVLDEKKETKMAIHDGELLLAAGSGLPSSPSSPSLPDHFGTFNHIDSILFEYLQLLSPNIARELISFVLSQTSPPLPPTIPSTLYQISNHLLSIPTLEISLFGGLRYSDIHHSISSLSNPLIDGSNSLFFGSSEGQMFRKWALGGNQITVGVAQNSIKWSRGSLEIKPVSETNLSSISFEAIWSGSSLLTVDEVWKDLTVL